MKGWLIRAQQPQRKRISCKGQAAGCRRWLHDTSKRKLADFLICFAPPPPSSFPGFTRSWPDHWSKQALMIKKIGLIQTLSQVYPKNGEHAPCKSKIADSTRNQRVLFSRYFAANYERTQSRDVWAGPSFTVSQSINQRSSQGHTRARISGLTLPRRAANPASRSDAGLGGYKWVAAAPSMRNSFVSL